MSVSDADFQSTVAGLQQPVSSSGDIFQHVVTEIILIASAPISVRTVSRLGAYACSRSASPRSLPAQPESAISAESSPASACFQLTRGCHSPVSRFAGCRQSGNGDRHNQAFALPAHVILPRADPVVMVRPARWAVRGTAGASARPALHRHSSCVNGRCIALIAQSGHQSGATVSAGGLLPPLQYCTYAVGESLLRFASCDFNEAISSSMLLIRSCFQPWAE